jgi:hypothetical protein
VCKGFANALDKSAEIQEKLFLRQRVKSKESAAHEVLHGVDELNPFFAIDRALATDEGISMRDAVLISFESSLLRTYLCDFPCKEIHLDFDLHAGKGRSISFDCWVHDDDGGTISDILKRAVFEQWGGCSFVRRWFALGVRRFRTCEHGVSLEPECMSWDVCL